MISENNQEALRAIIIKYESRIKKIEQEKEADQLAGQHKSDNLKRIIKQLEEQKQVLAERLFRTQSQNFQVLE